MLCTKIGPEEDVSHMWACLDKIPNWREKIRKIESEMTVAQWVTTPWHYETLPYQHQYAIFKDGEGFSEGCRRCSRSFYEYGYLLYGDAQAAKGAQHWPQSFYKRNENRTRAVRDAEPEPPSNLAPLPFTTLHFGVTMACGPHPTARNHAHSVSEDSDFRMRASLERTPPRARSRSIKGWTTSASSGTSCVSGAQ